MEVYLMKPNWSQKPFCNDINTAEDIYFLMKNIVNPSCLQTFDWQCTLLLCHFIDKRVNDFMQGKYRALSLLWKKILM